MYIEIFNAAATLVVVAITRRARDYDVGLVIVDLFQSVF